MLKDSEAVSHIATEGPAVFAGRDVQAYHSQAISDTLITALCALLDCGLIRIFKRKTVFLPNFSETLDYFVRGAEWPVF